MIQLPEYISERGNRIKELYSNYFRKWENDKINSMISAEEKKKKSKGLFSLFRKDSESSKANQNASPSSTEKITSSMAIATLDEKDKHKPR